MLLINSTEKDQKNALTPAWIAGIVYLLIGIIEIGLDLYLSEESDSITATNTMLLTSVKLITIVSFFSLHYGIPVA